MKKKVLLFFLLILHSSVWALKILVVVGHFPSISEVCILNQIIGLIDRGHDVTLFAQRKSNEPVVHHAIAEYRLLDRVIWSGITPQQLQQFDLILCQFGTLGRHIARIKHKYCLSVPLATCFRGYDTTSVVKKDKKIYEGLFAVGDLFLPVCDVFRQKLIALGAPPEKVVVQHSAIDCSLFKYRQRMLAQDDTINIIIASRLVPKKGHIYLLRALPEVIKQYPQVRCTIIGNGNLRSELEQQVLQLGLTRHVRFIGALSHNELANKLDEGDLFVLPSVVSKNGDSEGIPNALKEAMAMGIPVISTYHSGIPELIQDKYNGLLVPEKDAAALSNALRYAIEHPRECAQMARCAYDTIIQEYERESQNDRLDYLLQRLCKEE